MKTLRIPTQSEHAAMQRLNAAYYAGRTTRAEPVKSLRVVPDEEFNLAHLYSLPRPGEEGELAGSVTSRTFCAALVGIGVLLVAAIELGANA